jgi:hypothetical protein
MRTNPTALAVGWFESGSRASPIGMSGMLPDIERCAFWTRADSGLACLGCRC